MLAGPIEMSNKSLLSGSDGHKNNISFANINTFLCKIKFWDYSHDSYFQRIAVHLSNIPYFSLCILLKYIYQRVVFFWPSLLWCLMKNLLYVCSPIFIPRNRIVLQWMSTWASIFHNYQAYTLHLLYFTSSPYVIRGR